MISDFEVTPTNYFAPEIVDGWTVLTNGVSVVTDTNLAATGTNFLALAAGSVVRTLPTVPGQQYRLKYSYRDPGVIAWWPGLVTLAADEQQLRAGHCQ